MTKTVTLKSIQKTRAHQFLFLILFIFGLVFQNAKAQTYILNEDFSAADSITPPPGWENINVIGSSTDLWRFDNPAERTVNFPIIGKFAIFDSDFYSRGNGAEQSELLTPYLDCSFNAHILLFFDHFFAGGRGGEGTVEIWDGSAWNQIVTYSDSTENPTSETYDISTWAGGNTAVRLKFRWEGDSSMYWAIDNIKVLAPLNYDAGIVDITAPQMPFDEGTKDIKISLRNYGYETINNTTIRWKANGIEQIPFNWNGNLPYNSQIDDINIGSLNFPAGQLQEIQVWQENPNSQPDENPQNDSTMRSLAAAFCGDYTIGGADGDFDNFTQAVSVLTQAGIQCPVVFNVRDGIYEEQIAISGDILGTSASNTVTFQSESEDSSAVVLSNTQSNYSNSLDYTLKLENVRHLNFRQLSFYRKNGSYNNVLYNADHILYSHCNLQYASNEYRLENCDSLTIENSYIQRNIRLYPNNHFIKIKNNILKLGIKSNYTSNNNIQITGNIIDGIIDIKADGYPGNSIIENNTISSDHISSSDCIKTEGNNIKRISGNRLIIDQFTTGINCNSPSTEISNNYINISRSGSNGIYLGSSADSCTILFNTVKNLGQSTTGSRAFSVVNGVEELSVKNNIFSCINSGIPAYIEGSTESWEMDYNDYYSRSGSIGYYNDSTYKDFTAWQDTTHQESNGIHANPAFISDDSPEPTHSRLYEGGINIVGINTDIDNKNRSNPPDIGALEFNLATLDAGCDFFTSPENPMIGPDHPVKVTLINHGTDALTSVDIQWSVNEVLQEMYHWTGNLSTKERTEITLSSLHNFSGAGIYDLKSWTENPNSTTDIFPQNDTAFLDDLVSPLCGTYTIGGGDGDFADFSSVALILNEAGITCPVVFNIRDGIYNESIYLENIQGSSSINTITFQSESSDSSLVSLKSSSDYTLYLNDVKYIYFKNIGMTITSSSANLTIANSSNIHLENCSITHKYTWGKSLLINNSDSLTFQNNYIDLTELMNNTSHLDFLYNELHGEIKSQYYNITNKLTFTGNTLYGYLYLKTDTYPKSSRIDNNIFYAGYNKNAIETNGPNILSISGNRILDAYHYTGIYCNSPGVDIINNFIETSGEGGAHGIGLTNKADSCRVLFNTVNHKGTNSLYSRALWLQSGLEEVQIKNNIFSCKDKGIPVYIEGDADQLDMDNNGYFSAEGSVGYIDDSVYTNLESWKAKLQQETNAVFAKPFFNYDSIPKPNTPFFNAAGQGIAGITTDLDGNLRGTPPDIGAVEFEPASLDAGIEKFTSPENPLLNETQPVKILLMNLGQNTLNSVEIHWTVNDEIQQSYNWNGSLATGQEEIVTIATAHTFNNEIFFNLKAWTEKPNNLTDEIPSNDTARINNLVAPICGSYTIGGDDGDFSNFTEALTLLTESGITCPVTFVVRDGIYEEQLYIGNIPGLSGGNTITFESESGDSSAVIIHNIQANWANIYDYTIKIENAGNISFRGIGIKRTGGQYNLKLNNTHDLNFEGCLLTDAATSADINTSSSITLMNSYMSGQLRIVSGNSDFTIVKCIIHDYTRVYSGSNYNIKIKENTFYRNLGIYVQLNNSQPQSIIENNTFYAGGNYDVIKVQGNNTKRISGNRILNANNYTGIVCETPSVDIINNFVDIGGDGNGIYLSGNADDCRVLFNTVNHRGTNSSNSRAIAIADDANNLLLKNNIFSCKNNGTPMYIDGDASTFDLDYNNYYCPNGNIGYYNGSTYTSLFNWGLDLSSDANSKNINPFFPEDTIPLPYQRQLNGAGLPISGIATDINGKLRNDQAPDIGAVEFMVDFGITRLINPSLSCAHEGIDSVTVLLRQFGDIPFTDIKIAYQVNGGSIIKDTIHGSINNDLEYTFSEGIDISATGDYEFRIWLISTNDDNRYNDTLIETRYSKPSPEVSFSWSPECAGTEIQFNGNASVGGGHYIAGYEWIFNTQDSSIQQDPLYAFSSGGEHPVHFRAYSDAGCYGDTTEMIQVWYNPQANYTTNNSCSNDTSYFTDESLPMEGAINNWNWSFGDGGNATTQNTKHKYSVAGDYESQLIVTNTNGCKDTLAQSVHVYEIPIADFSVDTVVVGQAAEFNDLSTSSEGNILSWYWDFADGSNSAEQEPQHSYSAPGVYPVELTVTTEFGCQQSFTANAVVIDDIMAVFEADTACLGTPTLFTDLSVHNGSNITNWNWDFGDGNSSSEQNPQHIFASAGSYQVNLIITNDYNSTDDTTIQVIVAGNPLADFTNDTVCFGYPTHFIDNSTAHYGSIESWEWSFGENTQNADYTFNDAGTHLVRLVVENSNGCTDTSYQNIPLKPSPNDLGTPISIHQEILASYPFHGNALDVSGNNYNSTVHGASLSFDRFNQPDNAYSFDGLSDYIIAPLNLNFHQEISISFWLKIQALPSTKAAIFSNENGDFGRVVNLLSDGSLEMMDANGPVAGQSQSLSTGIWYHICAIWTGESNQIYVNTEQQINAASSPGGLDELPVVYMARPGNSTDEYAQISLDDINFYTRSITPEEINYFYSGPLEAITPEGLCAGETAIIKIIHAQKNASYTICNTALDPLTAPQSGFADTLFYSIANITSDTSLKIKAMFTSNMCERILDTTINIIVYPSPVSAFTYNAVCDALPMQFMDASTINSGLIDSYLWDFGSGNTSTTQNPSYTFPSSGDYPVQLISYSTNGCSDTLTQNAHVFALPTADFLTDTACWGDSTSFLDLSQSNEGLIEQWAWNFGDPASGSNNTSALSNPKHIFEIIGDYQSELVVLDANGCGDTIIKTVPAGKIPQAFAGQDTSVCVNGSLQLYGEIAEAGSWNWQSTGDGNFEDVNALTTLYHPGSNDLANGSFQIILNAEATAPCLGDATDTMDVQVVYLPVSNAGADTHICENASLSLNGTAENQHHIIWTSTGDGTFDDAASLTTIYSPGINDIAALSTKIILTAFPLSPCGEVSRDTVQITLDPLAEAHAGEDSEMCSDGAFQTTGWVQYASGMQWGSSGDGSFDDPGSSMAIYTAGENDIAMGSTKLYLKAFGAASCTDEATDSLILSIIPPPIAEAGEDATVCENATIILNGSTENSSSCFWSTNGDGSFDDYQSLNATYSPGNTDIMNGSLKIYLNAHGLASACIDHKDSLMLYIQYLPQAFAGDDFTTCSINDIHLEGETTFASSSVWGTDGDGVFDDPSNLHNVYHPGEGDLETGFVEIWLTAEGETACQSEHTDTMRVDFIPMQFAFAGNDVQICAGNQIELYGSPASSENPLWTTSGDGTFNDPNILWPVYTPGANDIDQGGTELQLTIYDPNGYCPESRDTVDIILLSAPVASYSCESVCFGKESEFINESIEAETWFWDFGDGNTSTEEHPHHLYAQVGTYTIMLIASNTNACTDTIYGIAEVLELPQVAFSFNLACMGEPTNFINQSGGSANTFWHFGDGESSTETDPQHTYSNSGSYTVWLITENVNGCIDSISHNVQVLEKPQALFEIHNGCFGQTTAFTDISSSTSPITHWLWNFGDGSSSEEQNPQHQYTAAQSYLVELSIETENGCSGYFSKNIWINNQPEAAFSYESTCSGQYTQFTDQSQASGSTINSWLWDFGDGQTSTEKNPAHLFTASGNYSVKLIITTGEDCSGSSTQNVYISELPTIYLGADTAICPGDIIYLNAGNFASYEWQDGSNAASLMIDMPGIYWVKVMNTSGCTASDTIIIGETPGIDISGHITLNQENIAEALVKIHKWENDHLSPAFDSAYSDGDGHYVLHDISPCSFYLISAESVAHENTFRTWYEQAPYWHQAQLVDTSLGISGSGIENIDIDLLTFYNGGVGDGILCGNVHYDDHSKHPLGEPIKNVDISLEKLGTEKDDTRPWYVIKRTKTDAMGDYCFTEVNGGDYRIVVDLPCLPMDSMYYLNIYQADTAIYGLDYVVDSSGIYIITTGIDDIKGTEYYGKLSIWPNPNKGQFTLNFNTEGHNNKLLRIDILDLSGKLIRRDNYNEILDLSFTKEYSFAQEKGVFILRFICDDFVLHKRIIID